MAKKESTFTNMTLTLLIVTLLASTALGFVYEATKEPIAEAKLKQKKEAIEQVVPAFDNSPLDDQQSFDIDGGKVIIYPAKKSNALVGVAVETFTNKGFGGNIQLMVGFDKDGAINNYQVLEHKETPGLGTKMDDWFKTEKGKQSILGKNPGENNITVSKDGGEIDAITAATISSRAFFDAVNRGYKVYSKEFK